MFKILAILLFSVVFVHSYRYTETFHHGHGHGHDDEHEHEHEDEHEPDYKDYKDEDDKSHKEEEVYVQDYDDDYKRPVVKVPASELPIFVPNLREQSKHKHEPEVKIDDRLIFTVNSKAKKDVQAKKDIFNVPKRLKPLEPKIGGPKAPTEGVRRFPVPVQPEKLPVPKGKNKGLLPDILISSVVHNVQTNAVDPKRRITYTKKQQQQLPE